MVSARVGESPTYPKIRDMWAARPEPAKFLALREMEVRWALQLPLARPAKEAGREHWRAPGEGDGNQTIGESPTIQNRNERRAGSRPHPAKGRRSGPPTHVTDFLAVARAGPPSRISQNQGCVAHPTYSHPVRRASGQGWGTHGGEFWLRCSRYAACAQAPSTTLRILAAGLDALQTAPTSAERNGFCFLRTQR